MTKRNSEPTDAPTDQITVETADVRLDEIKAEIRESIGRAKALVAQSERLVRDTPHPAPRPEPK